MLGPINTEELKLLGGDYSPHAPRRVVQNPNFSGLSFPESLQNPCIQIVDFGEAFFTSDPPSSLGVPMNFLPPELCFGYSPSAMGDVWELACLLFFTMSNQYLISVFFPVYEILVGTAMPIVGPLPPSWRGLFDHEKYGYREDGKLQSSHDPDWWWDKDYQKDTIRGRMETDAFEGFSTEQRELLVKLLEEMLAFEPEKRLSAAGAAQRLKSIQ